jgi:hypothetical protein
MSKECIYDACWKGQCKNPTINDSDFCEEHYGKTCGVSTTDTVSNNWKVQLTNEDLIKMFKCRYSNVDVNDISIETDFGEIDLSNHTINVKGIEKKVKNERCDHQAIGDCHKYAGSFVCGTPLCEEHKKTHNH